MDLSRRQLLKSFGGAGAGITLTALGLDVREVMAATKDFKLEGAKEVSTACNFCACGCGMICHVKDGKLINLEGDPDHIVNEGSLCSKGAAMAVTHDSPQRATKPLYRAPYSDKWEPISWDDALNKIAAKMKAVRDANWIETEKLGDKDVPVRRTDAIAFLGAGQNTNEEAYLFQKLARTLGTDYIDHHARVCHSPTVPALAASFGRGAMTNNWLDMQYAKVFHIGGSNVTECHPMAAKWIMKAKEKGAIIIHVDPRFNRTSSIADIYVQIRPGTDIAYLGAVINYIIENRLYDEEYIKTHTNALSIMCEEFDFSDGLFSGYDETKHKYDNSKWAYALDPATNLPRKAESLDDPLTVFSTLKKHYSRYTLPMAEKITGIPADKIKLIAETMAKTKPGTCLYALGLTQHTVGVQNIRCYGILQLLLGNIGKMGGGVNAMRGQPNVQGACDMAVLYNYFLGYLAYPSHTEPTLEDWTKKYGTFRAKWMVNGLKAWFGDAATPQNDFGYGWLPKRNADVNYTMFKVIENGIEGKTKLYYIMGQNPLVTQPNLKLVDKGFAGMEMVVVQDLWETETACFWQRPGLDPKSIKTEVILLPASYLMEKEGTISNSGRMVQWRYKAVPPPGEARHDLDIIDALYKKVRDLYKDSTLEKDQIFKRTAWNYDNGPNKYEEVLKEINGYNLVTKELVNGIADLKADGTTSSGCWFYAGVFAGGVNLSKRKDNKTDPTGLGMYPNFRWTWPGNMKILYNRASADKNGNPYDPKNPLVWWDAVKKEWTGNDVPDVLVKTDGPDTPNGQRAFRMNAEGVGRLMSVPYKSPDPDKKGMPKDSSYLPLDGPMPEFYEPFESPVENLLHPKIPTNPCVKYPRIKELQPIGTVKDYPYVLMTSSIIEHWCSGSTTRNVPYLNELVPEPYVEMPEKLAKKLSISNGAKVRVWSARGEVVVPAMVTNRMQPMKINGEEVFMVWMPYNWGFKGLSTGPSTNFVTIDVGDPNTWCQETKACLVNLAKA